MPEKRFYDEYVENNRKADIKRAKDKVKRRLILLALILLLGIFLLGINMQKKEDNNIENINVTSAKSVSEFEPISLEDGSKITIERVTLKGTEGMVYLYKETSDNNKENMTISISDINENDNEIIIKEDGLNLKINLSTKNVEEVKE